MNLFPTSSFLYMLPVPRFFSQNHGQGGHVTHVCGILDAFQRADYSPVVVAEETADCLSALPPDALHIVPCEKPGLRARIPWSFRLIEEVAKLAAETSFRFAYVRYSAGFAPWLPRLKAALGPVPLMLEVNSLGCQRHRFMERFDRRALAAADVVVCISDVLAQFVRARMPADRQRRVLVLPNGVDAARFVEAEPEPGLLPDVGQHIGYCGVFKPGYGLEDLLDAFRELYQRRPTVHLHLFGDGPHRAALEDYATGLANVIFHGMAAHARMPRILKSLDALVGTTSEAHRFQSPIKLYEYMASGRPIVYARTPQTEAVLGHGVRGLLYTVGDARDLAAQLERLLADAPLGARLAQAAQSEAVARHSWDNRIQRLRMVIAPEAGTGEFVLPGDADGLPEIWDWYLNLEREIAAGIFTADEIDYLRQYYEEAGLFGAGRQTFFKRHYAATFTSAARFLLQDRPAPQILDLGCGTGTQSLYLALRGAKIVAVDMDEVALGIFCKRIAFYERVSGKALEITLCAADCFAVPYARHAPLDGVYSMFAFNMMQPSMRLLTALLPHMAADCRWAVIDGNNQSWRSRLLPQWRRSVWSPQEYRATLEQAGFQVTDHRGGIVLPPALWQRLPEKLLAPLDRALCGNWLLPVSHQILAERCTTAMFAEAPRASRRRKKRKADTEVAA